mmetsp:Transcript_39110/g.112418  ORF Transcript_39110/g.112418 Transcript_39110/m.112418 type:complete len:207 (+) Transcript_39110:1659-2279(+)
MVHVHVGRRLLAGIAVLRLDDVQALGETCHMPGRCHIALLGLRALAQKACRRIGLGQHLRAGRHDGRLGHGVLFSPGELLLGDPHVGHRLRHRLRRGQQSGLDQQDNLVHRVGMQVRFGHAVAEVCADRRVVAPAWCVGLRLQVDSQHALVRLARCGQGHGVPRLVLPEDGPLYDRLHGRLDQPHHLRVLEFHHHVCDRHVVLQGR